MKRIMSGVALAALVVTLSLTGCTKAQNAWIADYGEAQQLASEEGKDLLLFFSREDADGVSTQLRTSIFDTPAFVNEASKDYVLVHLDYSDSRMMSVQVGEDATEAEKKAAEEARPQLEKDIDTALRFSVDGEGMPVLLLTTAQGYVYGTIAYDASVTTPEQFLAVIDGNKENRDKIRALVKAIDESTGVDKLNAIDELYEATDPAYTSPLSELYGQAAELDPNNESGKRGKYAIRNAYAIATDSLLNGDIDTAIAAMLDPIDEGFCSDLEKQELLYQAAYFSYLIGDSEATLKYLGQALEWAPHSEMALDIRMNLEAYALAQENPGITTEGIE